jgi:hypothetical protein
MIYGPSLLWIVMVWPTTMGQEHQLTIETPVGPWP